MTPRHSFTARAMAYFKDRPLRWIPAVELEQFGRQAWRSRVSDARKRFEAANDGTIENRVVTKHQDGCAKLFAADLEEEARCDCRRYVLSEYRYVPASTSTTAAPHDINAWTLR